MRLPIARSSTTHRMGISTSCCKRWGQNSRSMSTEILEENSARSRPATKASESGKDPSPCHTFLRHLLLPFVHLGDLLNGRRVFRPLVLPPLPREPREPNRQPRAAPNEVLSGRVDRAEGYLSSEDLEDDGGLEPRVCFELRVHSRGPMGHDVRGESLGKGREGHVVEARTELAHGPKQVGVLIIRRHEERPVRSRPLPSTRERADDHEINRVVQGRAVFLLELDPLVSARAGVVRRVERLRHEPLASGLKGFVEERLRLSHVIGDAHRREANRIIRLEQNLESLAAFCVRAGGQVLVSLKEAVERKEGHGELFRHAFDFQLPSATPTHFFEREEFSCVRIDGDGLALDNRTSLANPRPQPVNDLGELSRRVLEMTREELDSLRGDVRLYSQAIVLVFEGRLPHAREDLLERLEALREHCPNRTE